MLRKNLISKHQHGFLSKHSTTTNLLESTHDWIVAFVNLLSFLLNAFTPSHLLSFKLQRGYSFN